MNRQVSSKASRNNLFTRRPTRRYAPTSHYGQAMETEGAPQGASVPLPCVIVVPDSLVVGLFFYRTTSQKSTSQREPIR